jgi:hypothetical protein
MLFERVLRRLHLIDMRLNNKGRDSYANLRQSSSTVYQSYRPSAALRCARAEAYVGRG